MQKIPRKSRIPPRVAIQRRAAQLSERQIPTEVGFFFERLMEQIALKTSRNASGEDADLQSWKLDAALEVKGGDDTHSFRIWEDQLQRYEEKSNGFFFSCVLYCLFRYQNRQPNGKTGLMRKRTACAREAYLLERTRDLWIVDHRILTAIANRRPAKTNALALDPERRCISVSKHDLEAVCGSHWPDALKSIGLQPREWALTQRVMRLKADDAENVSLQTELRIRVLTTIDLDASKLLRKATSLHIELPSERKQARLVAA